MLAFQLKPNASHPQPHLARPIRQANQSYLTTRLRFGRGRDRRYPQMPADHADRSRGCPPRLVQSASICGHLRRQRSSLAIVVLRFQRGTGMSALRISRCRHSATDTNLSKKPASFCVNQRPTPLGPESSETQIHAGGRRSEPGPRPISVLLRQSASNSPWTREF